MKNVNSKFESLIRGLHYNQIKLSYIDVEKIKQWAYTYKNMPLVVQEIEELGWDLTDDRTWLENTFSNHVLNWYNKKICVFITTSLFEFNLCSKILKTSTFKNFRSVFNIDNHLNLLVHPVIFIEPDNLDDIYITLDFTKGYTCIDYSHCDEDGKIDEPYLDNWGWLEYTEADSEEWDADQVMLAYGKEVYKYSN